MEIYDDDDRRLDAAVSLGIISADQAAAVRALAPRRPAPRPATRGASLIAYVLGAITVLVAMTWFLADRWDYLGPGGVLAVTLVYGALFVGVALRMRREGVAVAEGIAALLAVSLVPLMVIALNELTAWLPTTARSCGRSYDVMDVLFDFWSCRGLEVVIELSTLLAALVAWRFTRFSLFAFVIGGLVLRFLFHGASLWYGGPLAAAASAWMWVCCASLATASAYAADRRPVPEQDIGLWWHLLGAFSATVASVMLLNLYEDFRHLLLPGALVAFFFSLRMRRGVWTLLGLGWFVAYLGWLAAEVFRDSPAFPIILAALGIGVIVATVWMQRNRERLVARLGGLESGATPSFPGGVGLILLPALAALLQLPPAVELDRVVRLESRAQMTQWRAKRARERREEAADSVRRAREGTPESGKRQETPPSRTP